MFCQIVCDPVFCFYQRKKKDKHFSQQHQDKVSKRDNGEESCVRAAAVAGWMKLSGCVSSTGWSVLWLWLFWFNDTWKKNWLKKVKTIKIIPQTQTYPDKKKKNTPEVLYILVGWWRLLIQPDCRRRLSTVTPRVHAWCEPRRQTHRMFSCMKAGFDGIHILLSWVDLVVLIVF